MHPDETSFLEAIRAGDDVARLAFADWLEERGDPRGPWVRDPEIWAFMAPDATDPVPRLLDPKDGIPRGNWILLARIGSRSVPALIAALRDKSWLVRSNAAWALEICPGAVEAVPALATALGDTMWGVKQCVAKALGKIGAEGVTELVAALRDERCGVRQVAAEELGKIGRGVVEAIPELTVLLDDPDRYVRSAAQNAIERIRPTA